MLPFCSDVFILNLLCDWDLINSRAIFVGYSHTEMIVHNYISPTDLFHIPKDKTGYETFIESNALQ